MNVRVKLPPGELIEYGDFCRAIAQAIVPAGEQQLEGMACIVGKLVRTQTTVPPPAPSGAASLGVFQSVLVADDGRPLDNLFGCHDDVTDVNGAQRTLLEPVHSAVAEVEFRFHLSDDDRRALEEVLLKLPRLRYPMSEEEQAEFMNAYCELKGHPPWKPILVTSVELTRRKAQQDEEMSKQRHALRKAFKLGQLNAVDRSHVGVVELSIDCYFPREQAIAYLRWNGMEYCDPASDGVPSTTESAPDKANTELNGDPVCIVGILPDGADRRSAIYEFQRGLMKKGVKKFTKLTAEKFDISDSRVRKIVRDMKEYLEAKS